MVPHTFATSTEPSPPRMSKIRRDKVARRFGYLIRERGCFKYLISCLHCRVCPPLPSLFLCPHVAVKAAKAVSQHMHSHMASGFADRAFLDLDLVRGLKALGGG